jgi:hypothetical protein
MPPFDSAAAATLALPAPPGPPRRRRLRAADAALEAAWARGWADRPTLDPPALVARAAARTGLSAGDDDGRSGWRARLDLLCGDLEGAARLTPLGRTIAHGQLVAALSHRLRAQALWARHPAIAEQPLRAPIVVVGQMRSGTTRMQRLLACDPRFAYTRFFESWNPLPIAAAGAALDDRKLRGWAGLACARLLNPGFAALHPTAWNAADEEIGLQNVSIFGAAFEAQWRVPAFCAAVEDGDPLPAYREFRRLLQTVAWLRGDDGRRPWILKVPQFTQDLPALLAVFPDARLVCVSRDSAAVIASSVALVRNQMTIQGHGVDAAWIAREWTRKVRLRHGRTLAARALADVPQVDVAFDDVTRDWEGEMHRVYAMLRLPLTRPVRARMAAYLHAAHRRPGARRPAAAPLVPACAAS